MAAFDHLKPEKLLTHSIKHTFYYNKCRDKHWARSNIDTTNVNKDRGKQLRPILYP